VGNNENLYRAYAETCSSYKRCAVVDICSTLFQADPFLHDEEEEDLLLQEEHSSKTIATCPYNSKWIEDCWGREALNFMGDRKIVSGATFLGNYEGFSALLNEMRVELATSQRKQCGNVLQGHVNYL